MNSVNRSERYVSLGATVAQVEHTFAVSIATFGNGRLFANTNDPAIPARFANTVAGIHGLDNMMRVVPLTESSQRPVPVPAPTSRESQPAQLKQLALSAASQPDAIINGNGPYFGPNDLSTFYDITPLHNAGITGGGNDCLAIVGDSNALAAAVDAFNQEFSLPASTINAIFVDGINPGITSAVAEGEALLDLESSHAVAPGAI